MAGFDDKMIRLVSQLLERTTDGTVDWSAQGAARFDARLKNGSVSILSRDRDGQHPFVFSVFNSEGALVEELASVGWPSEGSQDQLIGKLYNEARGKALGISDTIDSLLDETG